MSVLLLNGNALQIPLADESVHCVVTSPPYWGLRDYGTATWEGGDAECDHIEPSGTILGKRSATFHGSNTQEAHEIKYKNICKKCGALRIDNQLGLEPTPEQYVENMVAVFREVRRVLRADGQLWLNLGDSFSDKQLQGIPWRVAFALQADGWWLRSDIIWSKPNPMPESVTDRPTKAHEYLFLLTKSARYYYDADAVREAHKQNSIERTKRPWDGNRDVGGIDASYSHMDISKMCHPSGRNRRTVWQIATAPYSGAHFATYPPALVEPCIKAGTSERGVCPECGAPWERVVEIQRPDDYDPSIVDEKSAQHHRKAGGGVGTQRPLTKMFADSLGTTRSTTGWQPTCECWRDMPDPDAPRTKDARKRYQQDAGGYWKYRAVIRFGSVSPATVFDPFAGSGTTLQVARALGRSGIGLDLSLEYLQLARTRLSLDALDAWTEGSKKDGKAVTDLPMFEELL